MTTLIKFIILMLLLAALFIIVSEAQATTITITYTIHSSYATSSVTSTPKRSLKKTYPAPSSTASAIFLPDVSTAEKDIITAAPDAPLIAHIFLGESTQGKADGCRLKGLYNGFGYRQNTSEWVCYPTFKEVVQHVQNWINERRAEGMDTAMMTCYYIQGLKTTSCDTSYKFTN